MYVGFLSENADMISDLIIFGLCILALYSLDLHLKKKRIHQNIELMEKHNEFLFDLSVKTAQPSNGVLIFESIKSGNGYYTYQGLWDCEQ